MHASHKEPRASTGPDQRLHIDNRPQLSGVPVREEDIEPVEGIRRIALLFRGMAILILLLMGLQLVFGLSSTVPTSIGVLLAEAVRLAIFAGLLWGVGDLAVLWVKSHHDLRATKILMARVAHIMADFAVSQGRQPPGSSR
jgi:hypothetical protein